MNMIHNVVLAACVLLASSLAISAPNPLLEQRYIDPTAGEVVARTANGDIKRRADVLKAHQLAHPCPSTGLTTGKCAGWAQNHDKTLACGGRDAVYNLSWMKNEYKTGYAILPDGSTSPMGYMNEAGVFVNMQRFAPDRVERKINALNPPIPDTANCVNSVVQ